VLGWFLSTSILPGSWSGGAFRAQFGGQEFGNRDFRFGTGNRAGRRNAVWGRLECGRKGAGGDEKFGKQYFVACDPCNPLKFHKTAKAFFGKAWRKQPETWKSLEKGLEAALIPPPPPLPQRCRPAAAARTAGRPCQGDGKHGKHMTYFDGSSPRNSLGTGIMAAATLFPTPRFSSS
jgi:hypothetical protein